VLKTYEKARQNRIPPAARLIGFETQQVARGQFANSTKPFVMFRLMCVKKCIAPESQQVRDNEKAEKGGFRNIDMAQGMYWFLSLDVRWGHWWLSLLHSFMQPVRDLKRPSPGSKGKSLMPRNCRPNSPGQWSVPYRL